MAPFLPVMWGVAVGIFIGVMIGSRDHWPALGQHGTQRVNEYLDARTLDGPASPQEVADHVPRVTTSIVETLTGATYHVHLFHSPATLTGEPDMPNITFVSHVTVDRIAHVRRWCRDWKGPMSISVFIRPFVDNAAETMQQFVGDLCIGRHAHLHMIKEAQHEDPPPSSSPHLQKRKKDMHVHYPSNVQRNTALDGSVGALVLLMDIDFHFLPAQRTASNGGGGEEHFRAHVQRQQSIASSWDFMDADVVQSAQFVVPAVETVSLDIPVPRTISDLVEQVRLQHACEFYGHYCKHCHHPTNLKKFLHTSNGGSGQPYLIDYEERYEPYVVLNKSSVTRAGHSIPRYNESFLGRFGDKFSFFYELEAQRRPFVVMSDYYLVHEGRGNDVVWPKEPGPEYRARERFSERLFADFKAVIAAKYATTSPLHSDMSGPDASLTPQFSESVEDPLLLAATTGIDWKTMSSSGASNWSRHETFACVATHRELLSDDAPTEVGTPASHSLLRNVEGLQQAISWACGKMDCSALQSREGKNDDAPRTFPRNVVAHADWVFGRWMRRAMETGRSITEACNFNGAATLLTVPEIGRSMFDDDTTGVELAATTIVGCTLNPDALVNRARLVELLQEICGDPAMGVSVEMSDEESILGATAWWKRAKKQRDRVHADRVGGGCQYMFQRLHPLLADDLRVRASAALLAHHLIFFAGGRGRTCRERFGDVASYLHVSTR